MKRIIPLYKDKRILVTDCQSHFQFVVKSHFQCPGHRGHGCR